MQKRTIRIKGLLSTSLFAFICNTYAQESVSSYEKSLINKNESTIQSQTLVQSKRKSAETPINFDMNALKDELQTRGWDTQPQTDGSLILLPQQTLDNKKIKKTDKNTSEKTQWQQLKQQLQNTGWSAFHDTDGSIHLTPPNSLHVKQSEEIIQKNSKAQNTFKDAQQKLRDNGWNVIENSDGSIFIYPPKNAASKKLYSCPGIQPTVSVPLPVDSWQEAHDIAQGWLHKESIPNSALGKIRKIFNVYIVSIVSDKAPYSLMHQIAIKKNNGAVIVLN
ncbi:MAG: hypothetical protein OQL19_20345 [Gammaproteobacteria bacterium]|nr:hypothetical protein [Gammaproteobacteria bacterium]